MKDNTLIIIDWDDTLYPTSWIKNNDVAKNARKMEKLDGLIARFLKDASGYGLVIIITNATYMWVNNTLKTLPLTNKVFDDYNIEIISARENYMDITNQIAQWKEYAFRDVVVNNLARHTTQHIISIGDAHYEYDALVNLCNWNTHVHKILKTVKCTSSPSLNVMMDQLSCMISASDNIFANFSFMDIHFELL